MNQIITGNPYYANLFKINITPIVNTLYVRQIEAQNEHEESYQKKEISLVASVGFKAVTPYANEIKTVFNKIIRKSFQERGLIFPSDFSYCYSKAYINSKPLHRSINYRVFEIEGIFYLIFDVGVKKCTEGCPCNQNLSRVIGSITDEEVKNLSYLTYGGTQKRLTEIQKISTALSQKVFPIKEGSYEIALNPALLNLNNFEVLGITDEPLLLFDQTDDSKTSPIIVGNTIDGLSGGLSEWGPFEKLMDNTIKVGLLAPSDKMQKLKLFVDGISNGSRTFAGGMDKFFGVSLEITSLIESETNQYEDELRGVFQQNQRPDILLIYSPYVEVEEESSGGSDGATFYTSSYFKTKAYCASEGVVTQMVDDNTLNDPTFKDINFALAIFAKTGHVPWVLAHNPLMESTDLILGISYSNLKDNKRRVVGYVNVFDSYGKWKFFTGDTKIFDFNDRNKNFEKLIKETISKYKAETSSLPKRIYIHYSKKFNESELRIITGAVKEEIGNAEIFFISINDDHPIRVFNNNSMDKSFKRGEYWLLAKNEFYLSTTGYNELDSLVRKRGVFGTPKLLHVKIWTAPEGLKFSIEEIVYQIMALTKLNWASVKPYCGKPISIKYANDIAYLINCFQMTEWKNINTNFRNKLWFV